MMLRYHLPFKGLRRVALAANTLFARNADLMHIDKICTPNEQGDPEDRPLVWKHGRIIPNKVSSRFLLVAQD